MPPRASWDIYLLSIPCGARARMAMWLLCQHKTCVRANTQNTRALANAPLTLAQVVWWVGTSPSSKSSMSKSAFETRIRKHTAGDVRACHLWNRCMSIKSSLLRLCYGSIAKLVINRSACVFCKQRTLLNSAHEEINKFRINYRTFIRLCCRHYPHCAYTKCP